MAPSDSDLVKLTDCANPVIAGALREYLEAHGVHAFVQGEQHSSMLGQLGSIMIGLNLLVPRGQLDEAIELLQAFEEATPLDEDHDVGADDVTELDPNPPRATVHASLRGKSARTAALLALVPGFGFGHFYSGAMFRGLFLAGLEMAGIAALWSNPVLGIGLIASAIFVDCAAGATRVLELQGKPATPELPPARVVERDGD